MRSSDMTHNNGSDILLEPTVRVRQFFEAYRGARVYNAPLVNAKGMLVGNHGDRLMVLGTDRLLADYDIEQVDSGRSADLIVVGGSGGMVEGMWSIPTVLKTCSQDWSDTPLVVLPSSYYFPTQAFAGQIGIRKAPVTLFSREPYSFAHLKRDHKLPHNCSVQLDHDMAFELVDTPFVERLRAMRAKHVLIVERTDVEHHRVAMDARQLRWRKRVIRVVGQRGKKWLYPLVNVMRSRQRTTYRTQCEQLLAEHHPDLATLPRVVRDISNVNANDFGSFQDAIGGAAVVFTTRLHVGLLSAMIGRPTFIFGGPYHKIAGIYRFSMACMNHVRLMEPQ